MYQKLLESNDLGDFTDIGPLKRQTGECAEALNDANDEMGDINVCKVTI